MSAGLLLFTGKGGVGKTTLAAATAARLAESGRKALVVSTDPAHSLGDAFGVRLGAAPTEVDPDGLTGLHAAQVDPRALVDDAWTELRGHLRTVLAGAGVDELDAEELTALPGVEELLALGEVRRLAANGPWEVVVVDCGPTAETLRLLALPEAFAGYLERLFPTHRRVVRGLLAGAAGSGAVDRWDATADALSRLAERLDALRGMLTSDDTAVRLVLTPERVVAAETRRTVAALALQGVRVSGLVANRLVPAVAADESGAAASWLRTRRAEQDAVLADLADLGGVRAVEHRAAEPVGVEALLEVARGLYGDDDPVGEPGGSGALTSVERDGDEYVLRLALAVGESDLDLARVGDELAVTLDGRRKLVPLPPLLKRCVVTGAELDDGGLAVRFRPDPDLWMR
ncbi:MULTISPECIES: ArsA family ATPase [Actinosynnema]|uniref:ArsA family ATPase n=1 Tax=Actinosynnema TaxID=40566 RepID=UPI0020A54BEF|nr:ArsA family ATPase [Actinosynnema pretiosum]MCP2093163.1 arsenite-transporting ATPase [Actinosynnema pretiosum]